MWITFSFDKDEITPSKLLTEYAKYVVGVVDMNVLSPEGWGMVLLEVIDTDNFRAVFGVIYDDPINKAIQTPTKDMKGRVKYDINIHYIDKHISI